MSKEAILIKKLKQVLSIQSVSGNQKHMSAYICSELDRMHTVAYYIDQGNIFVTKGIPSKGDY